MGRRARDGAHRAHAGAARANHGVPVVPEGARHATLNINAIVGGQAVTTSQTPCVADRCRAIFDRRFLLEEGFERDEAEIEALLDRGGRADAVRSSCAT